MKHFIFLFILSAIINANASQYVEQRLLTKNEFYARIQCSLSTITNINWSNGTYSIRETKLFPLLKLDQENGHRPSVLASIAGEVDGKNIVSTITYELVSIDANSYSLRQRTENYDLETGKSMGGSGSDMTIYPDLSVIKNDICKITDCLSSELSGYSDGHFGTVVNCKPLE